MLCHLPGAVTGLGTVCIGMLNAVAMGGWVGAGWEGDAAFCCPELGGSVSVRRCVVACMAGATLKYVRDVER